MASDPNKNNKSGRPAMNPMLDKNVSSLVKREIMFWARRLEMSPTELYQLKPKELKRLLKIAQARELDEVDRRTSYRWWEQLTNMKMRLIDGENEQRLCGGALPRRSIWEIMAVAASEIGAMLGDNFNDNIEEPEVGSIPSDGEFPTTLVEHPAVYHYGWIEPQPKSDSKTDGAKDLCESKESDQQQLAYGSDAGENLDNTDVSTQVKFESMTKVPVASTPHPTAKQTDTRACVCGRYPAQIEQSSGPEIPIKCSGSPPLAPRTSWAAKAIATGHSVEESPATAVDRSVSQPNRNSSAEALQQYLDCIPSTSRAPPRLIALEPEKDFSAPKKTPPPKTREIAIQTSELHFNSIETQTCERFFAPESSFHESTRHSSVYASMHRSNAQESCSPETDESVYSGRRSDTVIKIGPLCMNCYERLREMNVRTTKEKDRAKPKRSD